MGPSYHTKVVGVNLLLISGLQAQKLFYAEHFSGTKMFYVEHLLETIFRGGSALHCSNPNTATPVCVPTNTFPFATIGVMNLLPGPN